MGTSVGRGIDLVDPSIREFHHDLLADPMGCPRTRHLRLP